MLPALVVVLVAAGVRGDPHGAWPFLLTGLLGPGLSQILFTLAIRDIGASRTSVAVGCAPLASVVIAVVFLDESLTGPLLVGAVAIVSGGVLLAFERGRPEHLRARGLLYAASAALVFATRDNIVRALHAHANPETAAAATLLAGAFAAALWARRIPSRAVLSGVRAPGSPLRALLRLPLRGLLAGTGDRGLAADRDRVALRRLFAALLLAGGARRARGSQSGRSSSSSAAC